MLLFSPLIYESSNCVSQRLHFPAPHLHKMKMVGVWGGDDLKKPALFNLETLDCKKQKTNQEMK